MEEGRNGSLYTNDSTTVTSCVLFLAMICSLDSSEFFLRNMSLSVDWTRLTSALPYLASSSGAQPTHPCTLCLHTHM